MFSGRHPLQPDETGCHFIDRDPQHFATILKCALSAVAWQRCSAGFAAKLTPLPCSFLRDGALALPADNADVKHLLELRAEAEYYGETPS